MEDYDEAKLFKSNILDLRKEVDELISGHEIASLIASVLPTPEWEGESDHVLTNGGGDPTELPFHDQIIPGKTNATAHVSPTNGIESPATISSPGDDDEDEVTAFGNASRNIKSHVDYESRVSCVFYLLRCVQSRWAAKLVFGRELAEGNCLQPAWCTKTIQDERNSDCHHFYYYLPLCLRLFLPIKRIVLILMLALQVIHLHKGGGSLLVLLTAC